METCVRFLIALPTSLPLTRDRAVPETGGPEAAAEDEDAGNKEDDAAAPRLRWSRNYLVCLLHVISSLPQEFMNRNRKLNRAELNAVRESMERAEAWDGIYVQALHRVCLAFLRGRAGRNRSAFTCRKDV